jgi:hypothetical protein
MEEMDKAYHRLLQPSAALVDDLSRLSGDIIILGAGGKMGPSVARLAQAAIRQGGLNKKVIAVSRFSEDNLEEQLQQDGITTIRADLLNDGALQALPLAENVLYLAGTKFGTTGKEAFTWAMNTYLPGRVAEKYNKSRIVVFSTGNVYPLTPVSCGGATEDLLPGPLGEYAQSCLGRERLFQYNAARYNTPLLIYRLNYANDVSYGVLLEIGKGVKEERAIDLRMGHVNVIWQGCANEMALRSLLYCSVPHKILNIAGPETVSVRWIANEFAGIFNKEPQFVNEEQSTALLSNAAEAFSLFGYPGFSLKQMIAFIAAWINAGGKTLNKPTHFQERKGKF